jgi:hypothetical protein
MFWEKLLLPGLHGSLRARACAQHGALRVQSLVGLGQFRPALGTRRRVHRHGDAAVKADARAAAGTVPMRASYALATLRARLSQTRIRHRTFPIPTWNSAYLVPAIQ